ncbi:MAG: M10 family metallopeptidase C-terminal domain-containing protein [Paracoccaceae bacterium]
MSFAQLETSAVTLREDPADQTMASVSKLVAQDLLIPRAILPSSLMLRVDVVVDNALSPANGTRPNFASPVVVQDDLYIVDQTGAILRLKDTDLEGMFSIATDTPTGLTPIGASAILNMTAGPGNSVYIAFTSSTLPDGMSFDPLPDSSNAPGGTGETGSTDLYTALGAPVFQVIYKFDHDPIDGTFSNPTALSAFEARDVGHQGGAMLALPDGDLVFARGDGLIFDRDGLSAPQTANNSMSKLLIIDQDTGAFEVAALGVRSSQQMSYLDTARTQIIFSDIGAATAEEINVISVADLRDVTTLENFGWGRAAGDIDTPDGTAREGMFYVSDGATSGSGQAMAIARAPVNEPGFVQPTAQFGREDLPFVAVSGPVASDISFSTITTLFGDLVSGEVYALKDPVAGTDLDVHAVALVDADFNPTTLLELNEQLSRVDARFFKFPDGSVGVLSEQSGSLFALTELRDVLRLKETGATQLSEAADRFITTDADQNRVFGGLGDDVIASAAGADVLAGGGGADVLLGGAGADVLLGGLGSDRLTGGAGADLFAMDVTDFEPGVATADFITDFVVGEDKITLTGFGISDLNQVSFQTIAAGLAIDLGENRFVVFEGLAVGELDASDVSFGNAGFGFAPVPATMVHHLSPAADRFILTDPGVNEVWAGGGDDAVIGDAGADLLYGQGGADVLSGGAGEDQLNGGAGSDRLIGGEGRDSFVFNPHDDSGPVADFIADFEVGIDMIVLSGFDLGVETLLFQETATGDTALVLSQSHFVVIEGFAAPEDLGPLEQVFEFG